MAAKSKLKPRRGSAAGSNAASRPHSTKGATLNIMGKPFKTKNMNYRIAGHEGFPCRYTWLPKAVQGLNRDPKLFAKDERAMVDLGVGKNMVRAIRFWSQVCG